MERLDLSQDWEVKFEDIFVPKERIAEVMESCQGWLKADLPLDVRMPYIACGEIPEPTLGEHCFASEWVEQKSWWLKKDFIWMGAVDSKSKIELILDYLDTKADIFLNQNYLGCHETVHKPFVKIVNSFLKPGRNQLWIRLTTGMEDVTDLMLEDLNHAVCHEKNNGVPERGDYRRAWIRRPQYTTGWDWSPKVVTCGIGEKAYLQIYPAVEIIDVQVSTLSIKPEAVLKITASVEFLEFIASDTGVLECNILEGDTCIETKIYSDVFLASGLNFFDFTTTIKKPKLWWPNGYGEAFQYRLVITWRGAKIQSQYRQKFGIRTLSLDLLAINEDNSQLAEKTTPTIKKSFAFRINDVLIFAKGGNWIPADCLYQRVTKEHYHHLVWEAKEANFNMLRVWGGGIYEKDIFYELCSEMGILVWQDFMFACSTYPDHREDFQKLAREEMIYQVKRLRKYPALSLFCGNNENHWIFNPEKNAEWGIDLQFQKMYGLSLSNYDGKEITHLYAPYIPYWNSSPYGGQEPNCFEVGDIHYWKEAMMNPQMENRIDPTLFDFFTGDFVSEYGYPGPCSLQTTQQYLAQKDAQRHSSVWELHTNAFEKETVAAGLEKFYGLKAENLDLKSYCLYGGMVQSFMLEYSLEAFYGRADCYGSLFWMYNDTWGEVGWTIVDYYRRRKIAYYGVKRALERIKCIWRLQGENLVLVGINETDQPILFEAFLGYSDWAGTNEQGEIKTISLPSRTRQVVYSIQKPKRNLSQGGVWFRPLTGDVSPSKWMEKYCFPLGQQDYLPRMESCVLEEDGTLSFELHSSKYCHGVYFDGDMEEGYFSDNYFDMIPKQRKTIRFIPFNTGQNRYNTDISKNKLQQMIKLRMV